MEILFSSEIWIHAELKLWEVILFVFSDFSVALDNL